MLGTLLELGEKNLENLLHVMGVRRMLLLYTKVPMADVKKENERLMSTQRGASINHIFHALLLISCH